MGKRIKETQFKTMKELEQRSKRIRTKLKCNHSYCKCIKHKCTVCEYHSFNLSNYKKHLTTQKHIRNMKVVSDKSISTALLNWERLTIKFFEREELYARMSDKVYECKCCKYKTKSIVHIRLHWEYNEYHQKHIKDFQKEQKRLYYQKNKAKILAQQKEYRKNNIEKVRKQEREKQRRYYQKHKDKINEYRKLYYHKHRALILGQHMEFREKHRNRYVCNGCSYATPHKRDFKRHLNTLKHKNNVNEESYS